MLKFPILQEKNGHYALIINGHTTPQWEVALWDGILGTQQIFDYVVYFSVFYIFNGNKNFTIRSITFKEEHIQISNVLKEVGC